jgi:hypothetical protein
MANEPNTPTEIQVDDREVARLNALHAHKSKEKQIDMGKLGILFGARETAVIYLTWIIIMLAMIGGTIIAILDPSLRSDMAKALAAIAIAALGYMAGKGGLSS